MQLYIWWRHHYICSLARRDETAFSGAVTADNEE
jgi:hypothetical protein